MMECRTPTCKREFNLDEVIRFMVPFCLGARTFLNVELLGLDI